MPSIPPPPPKTRTVQPPVPAQVRPPPARPELPPELPIAEISASELSEVSDTSNPSISMSSVSSISDEDPPTPMLPPPVVAAAMPKAGPRASVPPAAAAAKGASVPPRPQKPIERVEVKIRRVGNVKVPLPDYQSALAAGMDLAAAIEGPLSIAPLARVLVPTGIAIALPPGFEAQVRPRSGLAWSRGLTVLNSPGTIDADYRGEIKVLLVNLGTDDALITQGERIAQLVVARHARVELELVEALDDTERGSGGYGSTGA